MQGMIREKAAALLRDGVCDRVMAWENGEFFYDPTPACFTAENIDNLVYNSFCAANLSKYLIAETKKDGKVLALIKPCDSYSLNELIREHRVDREKVYALGIPCHGKVDINKIRARGVKGIESIDDDGENLTVHTFYGDVTIPRREVLLERCYACKGTEHKIADEVIEDPNPIDRAEYDRFAKVHELEAMTAEERFAFWRAELSKCIRCNACRNVCPSCNCLKCVFDNPKSGVAAKANADDFEENMFHIIRAFHVAGRCTDCGECSRVCPQGIPLHLLNRKFIADINKYYGEYQAGADIEAEGPLTDFTKGDVEPSVIYEQGGNN
ncbi:MAG: 4Fe-4S dicluster domain-containing protein [Clostridia bacterium]|nr:4Fe-4S dicluster domain-containing protein [Clostridia bacterium]